MNVATTESDDPSGTWTYAATTWLGPSGPPVTSFTGFPPTSIRIEPAKRGSSKTANAWYRPAAAPTAPGNGPWTYWGIPVGGVTFWKVISRVTAQPDATERVCDRALDRHELVELVAAPVVEADEHGVGGDRSVDAGRDPALLLALVARPGQEMAAPGRPAQLVDEVGGVPAALVEIVEGAPGDLAQAVAAGRLVGIADEAEVLAQHHVAEHLVGRHGRAVVEVHRPGRREEILERHDVERQDAVDGGAGRRLPHPVASSA